MRRRPLWVMLALIAVANARPGLGNEQTPSTAKVGEPAPAFTLVDTAGKTHTLADLRGRIVVLEWINPDCPYVKRHYESRSMLETQARVHKMDKTVMWLAINSTHNATAAECNAWSREHKLPYPILIDSDGVVGRRYDARRTPEMFVIDKNGNLAYRGAIDDNRVGRMEKKDVKNHVFRAVRQLVGGLTVEPDYIKPYGCKVKYRQ